MSARPPELPRAVLEHSTDRVVPMDDRIAEHLRLLRSAVESAGESVIITTAQLEAPGPLIVYVNPAFRTLTGYLPDEAIGRSPRFLQGERTDRRVLDRLKRQLAAGGSFEGDTWNYRKDGTAYLVQWHVDPVLDQHGVVTHFVAIQRDVTAQWRRDADLRRAKALVEAAEQAKAAFFASMSHELRTPLNAIIGFSELLEDGTGGPLSERQAKYARRILSAGRALLTLIDQVLDIARVEVAQLALHATTLDAHRLLEDIAVLTRASAARKRVTVTLDIASDLPPVWADVPKLKQVFFSLTARAIRDTPEGGTVTVRARHGQGEEAPLPGDWLAVAVTDGGPGLSHEDRRRLLAEISLVEAGQIPTSTEGGGLGLALAQRLVELHGGRLWPSSAPGRGTTVHVLLPSKPLSRPSPSAGVTVAPPSGAGRLVLVVEDDPASAELLAQHLGGAGCRVAIAATAAEGLDLARTLQPFAITLDQGLPDGDGLDLLAELRSDTATRQIPVVMISVRERQERAMTLGAAEWLVKPVERGALLRALRVDSFQPPATAARPGAAGGGQAHG